ncbi:TPA: VirB4 family type IV secretion/conjugal transfer ATPase [Pasteurella multocida]|nr:VirB4 family type IV secretion/conjugal transfer ATPase [Pasteurella multocida]
MINKDPLFKALTRPAMFLGVPLVPFFITFAVCILIAIYTEIRYFIFFFPLFAILRLITKIDEKIFQLYGIKRHLMGLRMTAGGFKKLFFGTYYTSQDFSKERVKKNNVSNKGDYTVLDLEKAIPLKKIIPYSSLIAEDVVLSKDGFYTATWEIEGISYETRNDEDIERYKNSLNTLIRSLATENISVYTHNVRLFSSLKSNHNFQQGFAKDVNDSYVKSFKDVDFMENNLFFTVCYSNKKGLDKINRRTQTKDERLEDIETNLQHFQEITNRISNALEKFGAIRLTSYEKDGVMYSQQLEFYNFILTGNYQPVRVLNYPIYNYLGNVDMVMAKDTAEINVNGKLSYVRGIEIKDWVQDTHAGFLDNLIGLNCRYILTQSFSIVPKTEALTLIDRQLKQLRSTEDDGISQQDALLLAKDELVSGNVCFGDHHFTLMIYADTLKEVQKVSTEAFDKLSDLGFIVSLSNIALDETYLSQLPCNFKFRPRISMISSKNFVGLNSLHNNPVGKATNNCWGNAITLLKTNTNTPFYFNFHQTRLGRNDFGDMHLGHTAIIGKSGTGKTVLATFLLSQCTAFANPETFPVNSLNKRFTAIYLDKDFGAEIAVRAMGGKYNRLTNGQATGFNPFMLDKTEQNISFLNNLISLLATSDGSSLSTKDREDINFAVRSVMDLDKEYRAYGISRLLENIQKDIENENSLERRLRIWKKGGIYGWVFDNESDSLSFNEYSIYGFDGTEILDNPAIINPLAFYLLFRIQQILDGRRVVVFLDEFWKWLQSDSFSEFAYDGLKTMRKKNGFIVPITQSPDEIIKSKIARAIIEQVETFIFLPNSKADYNEYTHEFKVSEKEYNIIKSLEDDSRMFLVKKGSENDSRGNTVVAKLDLSALDRGSMKVLSGSSDNVAILDSIVSEVGNDPDKWLPIFKERMAYN